MDCASREGAGELGRLTNALCQLWPLPYELAKERELAPLPAGWTDAVSETNGETFYVNTSTGYTTWERPLVAASRPTSRSSRPPSRTSPTRPRSRADSRGSSGGRPSSRSGEAVGAVWADFRWAPDETEVIGEKPYELSWPRVTGAPGDPDPAEPSVPRGSFYRPRSPTRQPSREGTPGSRGSIGSLTRPLSSHSRPGSQGGGLQLTPRPGSQARPRSSHQDIREAQEEEHEEDDEELRYDGADPASPSCAMPGFDKEPEPQPEPEPEPDQAQLEFEGPEPEPEPEPDQEYEGPEPEPEPVYTPE